MAAPDPESTEDHHSKRYSERPRGVAADPLEPTTSGALLVQSLLHLHAPHNALVLDGCVRCKRFYSALLTAALQHRVVAAARAACTHTPPRRLPGARRHHRRHNDPAACAPLIAPYPGSAFRGRDRRPYWRALLGGGRPVSQGTQASSSCALNPTDADSYCFFFFFFLYRRSSRALYSLMLRVSRARNSRGPSRADSVHRCCSANRRVRIYLCIWRHHFLRVRLYPLRASAGALCRDDKQHCTWWGGAQETQARRLDGRGRDRRAV